MDPATAMMLAQAGASLIGGLFGGREKLTPEQKLQRNISRQLYGFSQSQPFSDPQERLAMGQDLGMLGEFAANQRQNLFAQMPALGGMSNAPDMLQNLNSLQTAQRMNLQSQHMMNALAQRRQAMLQAAGVASSVGPAQPTSQLPALMGQLAQAYAYSQAFKPQGPQGQRNAPGGSGLPTQHQDQLRAINENAARGLAGRVGGAVSGGIAGAMAGFPGSNGFNQQAVAQGAGAMVAPGNEPGGMNGLMNQVRQPMGSADPFHLPPRMFPDRRYTTNSGLNFSY
jgi:hypothetical protein